MSFAIMFAAITFAYFAPDLLIRSHGQKRCAAIQQELPNALDQMLISVQAGLGFEAAMGRTGKNGTGPLADEFVRTLQDIQVGRSRKEAYLAMAERVDVSDLRSFIRSIVQADAYGIAIAKVLKSQAREMRTKRRQRAEEHAMKIPVKILFPLIFFIFPTLFIILLGPAVMNIIAAFS
jgi:tight adherence protein C